MFLKNKKSEIIHISFRIVLTTLITCLLLEVSLRIVGYNPLKQMLTGSEKVLRKSTVPDMDYEGIPNAEGYLWNTDIKINSLGFRDREYEINKENGTYRVIVLGDSITFGNLIRLKDIYTEKLEDAFIKKDKKVEVLNLGITGYDTMEEVSALEHKGLAFRPDTVVVGYCLNDIALYSNLAEIMRLERYSSLIYKSRLVQFIVRKIDKIKDISNMKQMNKEEEVLKRHKNHITLINNDSDLIKRIEELKGLLKENEDNKNYLYELYTSKALLGRLRYSFEKLKKLSDENGFDVIIMIISYLHEDDKDIKIHQAIYNIVEHESQRLGFDVLNTYSTFKSAGFSNLQKGENDYFHPNELGHELMASLLYKNINSKLLLKKYDAK